MSPAGAGVLPKAGHYWGDYLYLGGVPSQLRPSWVPVGGE